MNPTAIAAWGWVVSSGPTASANPAPDWSIQLVWYILALGLLAYVLTGGADFGGGLWDLLARGKRAEAQRKAIEQRIAPIWEANHVWLIFIIVVVFTVFPKAFAAISIALHVPIVLTLIGIVLRGSAFVFRAYGLGAVADRGRWGGVFGWSSVITPVFLGMTLAGMSSGRIQVKGHTVASGFFAGWTTSFAVVLGLFVLALFALLAAAYLCADGPAELRHDFKRRAQITELVAGLLALLALWRAYVDAPLLWERMMQSRAFWPAQVLTALLALWVLLALHLEWYRVARICVAAQVVLIVLLWGLAMDGDLLLDAMNVSASGARAETIDGVLPALAIGFALCIPALVYLFRVFRSSRT